MREVSRALQIGTGRPGAPLEGMAVVIVGRDNWKTTPAQWKINKVSDALKNQKNFWCEIFKIKYFRRENLKIMIFLKNPTIFRCNI